MGIRPNQPAHYGRQVALRNPIESAWHKMKDGIRLLGGVITFLADGLRRSKAGLASVVASGACTWTGIVTGTYEAVYLGMAFVVVAIGLVSHANTRAAAAAPDAAPRLEAGTRKDMARHLADLFKAQPSMHRHDQPCACGSEEFAVEVEVQWSDEEHEVVGFLCPACGHAPTPKQLRVQAEKIKALGRATSRGLEQRAVHEQAVRAAESLPDYVDRYEYSRLTVALADVLVQIDALAAQWTRKNGAFLVSQDDHARYLALVEQGDTIRAALERVRRGDDGTIRRAPGSVPPRPGLQIEQGDWVYEIPWYAEKNLCAEDDHDWDAIGSHQQPVVAQVCATCGAGRRTKPQPITAGTIRTPDVLLSADGITLDNDRA